MSARKSSHRTIFLIASRGSPLLLIAASLRSRSKKPFCPMTRPLHLPIFARGYRVRFAQTWREEFFEAPWNDFRIEPENLCVGWVNCHAHPMSFRSAECLATCEILKPSVGLLAEQRRLSA